MTEQCFRISILYFESCANVPCWLSIVMVLWSTLPSSWGTRFAIRIPVDSVPWKWIHQSRRTASEKTLSESCVYWTVHHVDSWIKIDRLDVTRFIISLFTVQHFSNVSASIFRSLRLIVDLFHVLYCSGSMCVGVTVLFGWGGVK